MGLYGSAPEAPDPKETAAAQTSTNLATAIGNSYLGNINQVTPDGKLTYSQTGQNFVTDPNGQTYYKNGDKYVLGDAHKNDEGWTAVNGYYVPTFTATTELSKMQDAIKQQEDHASLNLASLANDQSKRIDNILGQSLNLSDAPRASNPSNLNLPDYQKYGEGPDLQNNIANAGNIRNTVANAGAIGRTVADAGNIRNSIANAGPLQKNIADAGSIQSSLGNAGDITKSYNVDFDTSKYADALMSRLNPQLKQDSDALNAKLVNQGLQPGSEAYNRAFQQQGQKENDARLAAILNAGQEQSRIAGLAQQQAAFQNAAQEQGYNQGLSSGNFANTAQAQKYAQNANNATFANQAQGQQYQQNANDAQFANTAQGQLYQQNANNLQLANAAQQQQYQQNANNLQLANAAQQQQYAQNANDAQFSNAARQQQYTNKQSAISGNNALQDQTFNARLTRDNAMDQARAQYLNEQYAQRNQSLNEITGLMSGAPVQNPNFVNTNPGQIANVDYAGIVNDAYKNQLAAYQQDQAGIGQLLGGLGGLFALSDRRAKKDIKKVGEAKGLGLYEYSMRGKHDDGKRHIGVMAQEVEKKRPDAVITGPDGLKRVSYGKLFAAGA